MSLSGQEALSYILMLKERYQQMNGDSPCFGIIAHSPNRTMGDVTGK